MIIQRLFVQPTSKLFPSYCFITVMHWCRMLTFVVIPFLTNWSVPVTTWRRNTCKLLSIKHTNCWFCQCAKLSTFYCSTLLQKINVKSKKTTPARWRWLEDLPTFTIINGLQVAFGHNKRHSLLWDTLKFLLPIKLLQVSTLKRCKLLQE